MAYYGLKKPIVAKRTAAGTYDIPQGGLVQFARAIAFSVAPTFAEAALACDDDPHGEYEKEFVEADVTLGTDTVPVDVNEVLFGATASASASGTGAEVNVVTYKKDDQANEVGTAVIGDEVLHGVKKWVAVFLPRVKYADPGEDFETKGSSITYKTPSITGKAYAEADGTWRKRAVFGTEAEAIAWIESCFGV
jgi:hypothetical protein